MWYDPAMSIRTAGTAPQAVLNEWTVTLDRLLADVESWAKAEGWKVDTTDKQIQERELGHYSARVLSIEMPSGRVHFEPIARGIPYADGRVDLYAWPSMHCVRLFRRDGKWSIRTDSGIDWPKEWGQATFVELAQLLAAAP